MKLLNNLYTYGKITFLRGQNFPYPLFFLSFFYSPIEQFYLFPLLEIKICMENIYFYPMTRWEVFFFFHLNGLELDNYLSVTNMFVFFLLLLLFVILYFYLYNINQYFIPLLWYLILEFIGKQSDALLKENVGNNGFLYYSYIYFLFFFLIIINLFGMIPYSYTITSHLIVTLTLAGGSFLGVNFIGIQRHGLQFFNLFLPSGTPLFIIPFLILVEIISYLARVFSLGIRLFANMMAGHTLLKILSGYTWPLCFHKTLFFLSSFALLVVCLITSLELAIAFLQAYVFSVLVCLYINDVLNVTH